MRLCLIWTLIAASVAPVVADDLASGEAGPPIVDEAPLVVRIYNVADLVVQPRPTAVGGGTATIEASPLRVESPERVATPRQQALENLVELSSILQNTIDPESWDMAGGPGHVAVHGNTFSLIVRQSAFAHEEIADLLDDLRRQSNLDIQVSIEVLSPTQDAGAREALARLAEERQGLLTPAQAAEVRELAELVGSSFYREHFTVPNGQSARSAFSSLTAVAAADRRTVQVLLEFTPLGRSLHCRIFDGQTAALPLLSRDGESLLVLISVQLNTLPEEEALLPATTDAAPSPLRALTGAPELNRLTVETEATPLPAAPSGVLEWSNESMRENLPAGGRARERRRTMGLPLELALPEKNDALREREVVEARYSTNGLGNDIAQTGGAAESLDSPGTGDAPAGPPPATETLPADTDPDESLNLAETPAAPHQPTGGPPMPRETESAIPAVDLNRRHLQILAAEQRIREMVIEELARQRELAREPEGPGAGPDVTPPSAESPADRPGRTSDAADRIRRGPTPSMQRLQELLARQNELRRKRLEGALNRESEPAEPPAATPPATPQRPLRTETDDHPALAGPAERHLREAAEHLEAAGLPDLAREIVEQGRARLKERFARRLREIEQQIDRLQQEAAELRNQLEPASETRRLPEDDEPERPDPIDAPPERPAPPPEQIL